MAELSKLSTVAGCYHIFTDTKKYGYCNMTGLQLADFVPNTLGRYVAGIRPKNKNFAKIVRKKLYDGCQDKRYRFGFKVLS